MALGLDKNGKFLLACSFGPDSMALFKMLQIEGYNFEVAHVNYGLREEAKKETENLTKYCEENNIVLHVQKVKKIDPKNNLEAECRKIRYTFFKKLCKKFDFDCVLVAHNQDDVIETFLMQKNRKGLVNHYGIAAKTNIFEVDVVRPLLNIPKADLLEFCNKNKVPYGIDSSNLSDEFERNKVRHNVVSKMSREKRQNTLGEIDVKNREIQTRDRYLNSLDLNEVKTLLNLNDEFLACALNIMARRHDMSMSISMALSKEIRKILESPKPNVRFPINSNIVFEKTYDSCKFDGISDTNFSYIMKRPSKLDTPFFFCDFASGASHRGVAVSDYPLTIRRANPSDTVRIKDYDVKVRRLFIDWKMPIDLRDRWPVIVNCNGEIVYIPHYQADFDLNTSLDFYVK